MYPNLYYVFKDWFGVEWGALKILNSFGLFVALAFVSAATVISAELKRKEKAGLLSPREETITVGKPASVLEIIINGTIGFLFGYIFIGLLADKPEGMSTQEFIFSGRGNFLGGIIVGAIMAFVKWRDKSKTKLKSPEKRIVRIWPHDRVGDFVILSLVFGILGAKLFDNFEHWDEFMKDPLKKLFSISGLTFYGGLIVAAVAVMRYAYKKGIRLDHLVDAAAPCLMIAYAVGRIGCQVAGDGDWGVNNSAYQSDAYGNVSKATPAEYRAGLEKHATYYLKGESRDTAGLRVFVTDRVYPGLDQVPSKSFEGPAWLPAWLFAYSYPQNVNNDGVPMPGATEDHYTVLPSPVFPTPLYETIIGGLMFGFLWFMRRRITTPLVMFGLYLVLNGLERYFVEGIRVNQEYNLFGIRSTQAQIIAMCLMLAGAILMVYAKFLRKVPKA